MSLNPSAMIPQSRGVRNANGLCFLVGWLVSWLVGGLKNHCCFFLWSQNKTVPYFPLISSEGWCELTSWERKIQQSGCQVVHWCRSWKTQAARGASGRSQTECQGPRWHQGNASPPRFWASPPLDTHQVQRLSSPGTSTHTFLRATPSWRKGQDLPVCVGGAVGKAWPGCAGTHLHLLSPTALSAEGGMGGRGMPCKLEPR